MLTFTGTKVADVGWHERSRSQYAQTARIPDIICSALLLESDTCPKLSKIFAKYNFDTCTMF